RADALDRGAVSHNGDAGERIYPPVDDRQGIGPVGIVVRRREIEGDPGCQRDRGVTADIAGSLDGGDQIGAGPDGGGPGARLQVLQARLEPSQVLADGAGLAVEQAANPTANDHEKSPARRIWSAIQREERHPGAQTERPVPVGPEGIAWRRYPPVVFSLD